MTPQVDHESLIKRKGPVLLVMVGLWLVLAVPFAAAKHFGFPLPSRGGGHGWVDVEHISWTSYLSVWAVVTVLALCILGRRAPQSPEADDDSPYDTQTPLE